jgi:hypothetical protein
MGLLGKLLLVSVTVAAIGIGYIFYTLNQVPQMPELENTWWGAGQPRKLDESIREFKISISDDVYNLILYIAYNIRVKKKESKANSVTGCGSP